MSAFYGYIDPSNHVVAVLCCRRPHSGQIPRHVGGARCPGNYFEGTITKVHGAGETYDIKYDDGDTEKGVLAKYVRASESAPAAKRKTVEEPPATASAKSAGKRKAAADATDKPAARLGRGLKREPDSDSDDDVVVAPPPKRPTPKSRGGGSSSTAMVVCEDEDEDVQYQGRSGDIALVDYPHTREHCVNHPFIKGKEKDFCENCYCYVCDVAASSCPCWAQHCKATHTDETWQAKRKEWKENGGKPPSKGKKKAADGNDDEGRDPELLPHDQVRWKCDQILEGVQQVFPIETPEPEGFGDGLTLRPYQRQSLAFMLQNERSNAAELLGGDGQRGGWLCDEVGMGKTAVCAALMLANPCKEKPVPDEAFAKLLEEKSDHVYKLTIVIVNNTLVQQWYDELKKFAPGLDVRKYYGGDAKAKQQALTDLRKVDVLITTPHMKMPFMEYKKSFCPRMGSFGPTIGSCNLVAHRLIMDEAHLLAAKGSSTAEKLSHLMNYRAKNMWLVTGTPFTTSLDQLEPQARMLGQWDRGVLLRECVSRPVPLGLLLWGTNVEPLSNEVVVDKLRKLMIRHTKAMRIGGEVALALPDKESSTRWLDFTPDEKKMYELHRCAEALMSEYQREGHALQLNACSHLYDPKIISGGHSHFKTPLAEHLARKEKWMEDPPTTTATSTHSNEQHEAYDRLQRAKAKGRELFDKKTYDVGQFPVKAHGRGRS